MSTGARDEVDVTVTSATRALEARVGSVLLGKAPQVRLAVAALLAGEHLLLNDLPGVGKTTLGAALARVIDGELGRVQGTPDLLPTDLTGYSVYHQHSGTWTYRPGPLMAHVVLVDEVNRITPRTQSALLEAMAEGQVTVDGITRRLPRPFLVVATMNPLGSAGTFPLTAGQLDRFGLALSLGPIDRPTQRLVLRGQGGPPALDQVEPVLPADLLPDLQGYVAQVQLSDLVLDYVLDLCQVLERHGHLSARAPGSVVALARALAVLDGRTFVVPDDVKRLAVGCLAHRLAGEGEAIDSRVLDVCAAVDELAVPDLARA